ncbi:hypothetical protein IJS98_04580 [bacterium]|nr:hypothetical protein [bacterium]
MKKLLLLALSLLFMLAACKAKTDEPKAQAPETGNVAAEGTETSEESLAAGAANQKIMQISMEVMQDMRTALETDDYKALNEKIDALKEENADDQLVQKALLGAKFTALLFAEDFEAAEKLLDSLPDPEMKKQISEKKDQAFSVGNINLTKANLCYQLGLEEKGDALLNSVIEKEQDKTLLQMAMVLKARKFLMTGDTENFEKTMQSAIDVDPTSELSQNISAQMSAVSQMLKAQEETEAEEVEQEKSEEEEEAIKEPAE